MINRAALYTIMFNEANNALGLLNKNQNSKNVSSAIFDDFDRLINIMYFYLTIKKNLSNALRDYSLTD